jgi:hypothetical protein
MEIIIHPTYPQYTDAGRQMTVDPEYPGTFTALGQGIEMGNLAVGMHTGIRTSTAIDTHFMVRNLSHCLFQATLNGWFLTLDLPTQESTTIVFQP